MGSLRKRKFIAPILVLILFIIAFWVPFFFPENIRGLVAVIFLLFVIPFSIGLLFTIYESKSELNKKHLEYVKQGINILIVLFGAIFLVGLFLYLIVNVTPGKGLMGVGLILTIFSVVILFGNFVGRKIRSK